MRQHGHGEARRAADLNGMGIGRADTKMLGKYGGEHDVRRYRAVAAENAVDLSAFEASVGDRKFGGLAHEVERGRAFVLAVGCEADAGDEAHGSCSPPPQGGREKTRGARTAITIPILNTTSAGPAPSRR